MNEEILDHESTEIVYNRFRILPLILEFTPWLIAILGLLFGNPDMTTLGFCLASFFYITLSWYFFKGLKFAILDIIIATFFGVGFANILLSMLFFFMKWEFADEMLITGHIILFFCGGLSLLYLVVKKFTAKNKEYEFTLSQKILSRYVLLFIIFYASGMNSVLEELF